MNLKYCPSCKENVESCNFAKNKATYDGFSSYCKLCSSLKRREWREANKEYAKVYAKNNSLKRLYNITIEDYNLMFEKQKGCCKICNIHQSKTLKNLFVDHNHETGEVRALLCHNCNTAIGLIKEDTNVLASAIKYLNGGYLEP